MSDSNEKYRAEFKAGTYRMTEEQFVSLRRCEDGLEEFLPSDKSATDGVTVGPDDLEYLCEYRAEPAYAKSMTLERFVGLRRAEDGKERFIPDRQASKQTSGL